MKHMILTLARITLIGVLMLNSVSSVSAKGDVAYQTGFIRWRAADHGFSNWALSGVKLNAGALEFDSGTASAGSDPYTAGTYNGGNYYNGGSFKVGEATSPEITTAFDYKEAIASWNASTPAGSWVEIQFRAQYGMRWSKWYILGIWASDDSTVRRHSVQSQGDSDGFVAVDTFVSSNKKETTNKFQLKLRLFSEDGLVTPAVRNASVAYSTSPPKRAVASPNTSTPISLNVPGCSQMVYPDGGEVWCSPTSTSMVLAYLDNYTGPCEPRVRAAVDGVFDWIYDGHGNWPFNTAYAATQVVTHDGITQNLEGYVARFTSLAKAEEFVAEGVPVIMSIAWGKGDLTGASIESTNGHLLVLVGFDASGNPIVSDPAAPSDAQVRRTYLRSEFEPLWLQASGGTVYLIYPQGTTVPALP
jgi:hypothetical protein